MGIAGKKVDTRTNVGTCHKLESERSSAGRDTVGARIVGTIKGTVRCASDRIGTKGCVPGVSGIAVGSTRRGV